jgi:hypothetical protein
MVDRDKFHFLLNELRVMSFAMEAEVGRLNSAVPKPERREENLAERNLKRLHLISN